MDVAKSNLVVGSTELSALLDDPECLHSGEIRRFRSFVHVTEIRCMNDRECRTLQSLSGVSLGLKT
jgi:hypothetical protein